MHIFVPYFFGFCEDAWCFPWQQLLGHIMSPEETAGHAKFTVGRLGKKRPNKDINLSLSLGYKLLLFQQLPLKGEIMEK